MFINNCLFIFLVERLVLKTINSVTYLKDSTIQILAFLSLDLQTYYSYGPGSFRPDFHIYIYIYILRQSINGDDYLSGAAQREQTNKL